MGNKDARYSVTSLSGKLLFDTTFFRPCLPHFAEGHGFGQLDFLLCTISLKIKLNHIVVIRAPKDLSDLITVNSFKGEAMDQDA